MLPERHKLTQVRLQSIRYFASVSNLFEPGLERKLSNPSPTLAEAGSASTAAAEETRSSAFGGSNQEKERPPGTSTRGRVWEDNEWKVLNVASRPREVFFEAAIATVHWR
jgi:hypothetical protein